MTLGRQMKGTDMMRPSTPVRRSTTLLVAALIVLVSSGQAIEHQEASRVREAVQALPAQQRLAVTLCYFEEFTNPEAAEYMGLHLKALEGLLVRARRRLRQTLPG